MLFNYAGLELKIFVALGTLGFDPLPERTVRAGQVFRSPLAMTFP